MTRARILADYVSGGTTAAEFDYLDGVTSNVQTQLDAKSPTTGHANIATVGTVTSGTISTGAVIDDPTMTQGSDATGDVYYRAAGGALTRLATGADGTVLTSTGAAAVPAFEAVPAGGITEADQWYLTANTNINASQIISDNWARRTAFGQIGTGLTLEGLSGTASDGIFAFPSTGIWYINSIWQCYVTVSTDWFDILLYFTTNNSSYNLLATNSSGNALGNYTITLPTLIDVTSTTNVKFKWHTSSFSTTQLLSDSTYYNTHFTAIRLGDT